MIAVCFLGELSLEPMTVSWQLTTKISVTTAVLCSSHEMKSNISPVKSSQLEALGTPPVRSASGLLFKHVSEHPRQVFQGVGDDITVCKVLTDQRYRCGLCWGAENVRGAAFSGLRGIWLGVKGIGAASTSSYK
jgi:hypothetical protein